MSLPTGAITFLFTDIEGSTRLWEDYPEAMRSALAQHDAVLREAIESHNGHVFKTVGDAFYAVFPTASQALLSALSAQQALQKETQEEFGAMRVRMALHTGTAVERDNDYFGPTLNRLARLLAIGHGGQVLLSAASRNLLASRLPEGCHLLDLGSHRLKDLSQPEHVFQLLAPGLPSDFPHLRSLQAFANNLPIQLTSFIGREKESEQVKNLLAKTRLLTLTGSGGCGKTRLALQVAVDLIEGYAEGVWLVELAALTDASFIPQTLASVLGVREEPGRALTETLTSSLQSRTLLLLLDNCEHLIEEHLIEACARLAERLLRACPNLQILATSREAMHIGGETTYHVPSLQQPIAQDLLHKDKEVVSALLDYDAVRLFVERARSARPDFALTKKNGAAVVEVCHQLDGIPLGIELAAARVRMMSVEQIASRLDERFRLLTGGSRTAPSRQQTLRATMDWSYDLLSEKEQIFLHRLSVFAGGWILDAAEGVCIEDNRQPKTKEDDVLDLLSSLVDKSLVIYDEQTGSDRYRLLETVRQYGWERLEESGELAKWRDRHCDYFLALAETAEPQLAGPEQEEWLERLEVEHDNLRAAMEWSRITEDGGEHGLRLVGALERFWWVRGYLSEGRTYLTEALKHKGAAGRTRARAMALKAAVVLAFRQGDIEVARALGEESLAISRTRKDRMGLADGLTHLGTVRRIQGDLEAAKALHEESLALYRELGHTPGIASSLDSLGLDAMDRGELDTAKAFLTESLAINQQLGNKISMAATLNNLGNVVAMQGDFEQARALLASALQINRDMGNRHWEANNLGNLAMIAQEQGEFQAARTLGEESLTLLRMLGARQNLANGLNALGNVALGQEDYETAKALFEESLAIQKGLGDRLGAAHSLNNLGLVALNQGDAASARELFTNSLAIRRKLGDKYGIAFSLETFVCLAVETKQPERALRLWGAAESLREAIGSPLPPRDRETYECLLAGLRMELGEERFAALQAAGRMMTPEQAIEYVLEENVS